MDRIGRQVTTFVTLFMITALIVLMYMIFEPQRRAAASHEQQVASVERGAKLYADNCVVCHGATGQGIAGAGFPLNIPTNHNADEARLKVLRAVIERGRPNSTGKLPNMPAWLETENGAFNSQMIDDVLNFIHYGDFNEVPRILAANGTPVAALPTPPGLGTPNGGAAGGAAAPVAAGSDPGAAVFQKAGCVNCHMISPEFPKGGAIGPNLTGIASHGKIPTSQPTLDVNAENLTKWIRDPQGIKPGTAMPPHPVDVVSDQDMKDLVTWLLAHK